MKEKEVWIEFDKEAYEDYIALQQQLIEEKACGKQNTFNAQLLKSIERAQNNLKIDPQHGTHIPRAHIPKALAKRYGTNRLWKIDLLGC